jgi:glycosyltransferase involved in cell wall biosynthesis
MTTVDIALPVYNGARFLAETLESLRKQTHQDLRIFVVDNASTDETARVAMEAAADDARVVYERNATNVGAIGNFNRALSRTSAPFVMWASDHDAWEPEYIERCLDVFRTSPGSVLCFTAANWMAVDGAVLEPVHPFIDTRDLGLMSRVSMALWASGRFNYAVYGLFRRQALTALRGWPRAYPDNLAPDILLLAELAGVGEFAYLPEPLFRLRRLDDFGDFEAYSNKLGLQADSRLSAARMYARFVRELGGAATAHAEGRQQRLALRMTATLCGITQFRWMHDALAAQAGDP